MEDLTIPQIETTRPGSSNNSLHWLAAAGLSAAAFFAASKLSSAIRRPPVVLRGKVALITGGSRGLGLALAEDLGAQGCRLALCARDQAELDRAMARLRTNGFDAAAFPCDITEESALDQLLAKVIAHFGHLDILVNDAGLIKVSPLADLQHADFEEAMNLMFWAPVNLTLKVLPYFQSHGGGHIVNITSVGGRVAVPHLLPYCCAKFALVGFSTGLSAELDSNHIHVLTVTPGLMRTGSYLQAQFKGDREKEFAWFSLLGNLPGITVSAQDAARSIRQALRRREHLCTISLPAKLLIYSETLLPEATRTLMQIVSTQFLPGAAGRTNSTAGKALKNRFGGLFQALTSLGRTAARSFNE
jgi:short-subunit dehydrogenase